MDPFTALFLLAAGGALVYAISKGMNGGMTTATPPPTDPALPPLPDATSLDCDAAFNALPNDPPTYLRTKVKTLYTSGEKKDVSVIRNLADAIGSLASGDKLLTQAAQCLHLRANELEAGKAVPSFPLSIEPGSGSVAPFSGASGTTTMTGRGFPARPAARPRNPNIR